MNNFTNIIKKIMGMATSGEQVKEMSNQKCRVVLYPELNNINSVDELIGNNTAVIILYLTRDNYGHWCCLFKYPFSDNIEFFDSYGYVPDDELDFATEEFLNEKKINYPLLTQLLYDYEKINPKSIIYNEYQFQAKDNNISTCGRHVAIRLRNIMKCLQCYKNFIEKEMKRTGITQIN